MTFGELTTHHLGQRIRVTGGHTITIGAIQHETYHGKHRTWIHDLAHVRRWVYLSEQEVILS